MNFLDFLFLIPLAWLTYKGFSKGFVMELFSIAAFLVGIYACIHFTDWVSGWLKETFTESWATATICVYIVTFCAAFAGVYFFGKLIEKFFQSTGVSLVNKLAGGFLGLLKGALLISALLVAVNSLNSKKDFLGKDTREKSFLYEPLSKFSSFVLPAFNSSEWVTRYVE